MEDGAVDVWALDGGYREGAVDLLGILAYGALAAFERLAEDAGRAPTLADKVHGAEMAAEQVAHFDRVRDRLAELDVDVMTAMQLAGQAPEGMQIKDAKLGGIFNMGGAAVANYVSILEPAK